jgi:hypothetical protein
MIIVIIRALKVNIIPSLIAKMHLEKMMQVVGPVLDKIH